MWWRRREWQRERWGEEVEAKSGLKIKSGRSAPTHSAGIGMALAVGMAACDLGTFILIL